MDFNILTIFPEIFSPFATSKIVSRALDKKLFQIQLHDIRDYCTDKHQSVDDVPYGGGAGMIMKPEPLVAAIEAVSKKCPGKLRRIYLTPKGSTWNQTHAKRLLAYEHLIILCGRYQGVDQRVVDGWIDEEISIGDYILAGGEIPAMVMMETMMRLIPGVLGNEASLQGETHTQENPEYPQYTRPRDFRGHLVPEVLLNGNHAEIEKWRQAEASKIKPKST